LEAMPPRRPARLGLDPGHGNVPLRTHTTLNVGGPAEFFTVVTNEAELTAAVDGARAQHIPFRMIGGGSNILVPDAGLPGLTIKNQMRGWSEAVQGAEVLVTVGAGEVLDDVVARAVDAGYWGLENLSHIPGLVGATPVQNVGAYGVETADILAHVRVYNTNTGAFETLTPAACQFGYRDSIFKKPDGAHYLITAVTYRLSTEPTPIISYRDLATVFDNAPTPSIDMIRDAVIEIRARKFPDWTRVGTAGSFFKNPIIPRETYSALRNEYPDMPCFPLSNNTVKIPLGWVIDHVCDLRGVSEGAVGTYKGQALVIINNGGATADAISTFAHSIAESVHSKTGLEVEWEVTQLG